MERRQGRAERSLDPSRSGRFRRRGRLPGRGRYSSPCIGWTNAGGRRAEAAELLGISRKTLWEKIRLYEIAPD